jgi:hypothetical protein
VPSQNLRITGWPKIFAISTPHPPGSFWSRPGHGCYRNSAKRLSAFARSSLEALGVEVHTDSRVALIDGDGVVVNGERIAAGTVLWAALPSWPGLSGPPMITVMRECSWVPHSAAKAAPAGDDGDLSRRRRRRLLTRRWG